MLLCSRVLRTESEGLAQDISAAPDQDRGAGSKAALGLQSPDRVPRPVERGERFLCRPWILIPAIWRDEKVGAAEFLILLSCFRLLRLRAYGQPAHQGEERGRCQYREDDQPRAHDLILSP